MLKHMENQEVIGDSQHGFIMCNSCLTNLVIFYDDIIALVDKGSVGEQDGYTMNLLTAVDDGYVMTPHDWKLLLRMVLSAMQYAVFMTEYHDLVTAKALDNLTGNLNPFGVNELVAFENANADCRKVLRTIKNANPSITDMIKMCQDIGTETRNGPKWIPARYV
ncbi:endogenous retrovirus group k member 8 gag poly [Limosa lapponica baueri]|uniref:Endogenous retrovirus group k member 8 gag poly n=1 Tax=Limosa lapponica baueri TaxID=1758121 RepID=A0A2I0T7A3_LIMLA|nr:endogenous retrovirus group k member 8 gag poly [Limosa lapponica baueri]